MGLANVSCFELDYAPLFHPGLLGLFKIMPNQHQYSLLSSQLLGDGVRFYHPERWRELVTEDSPAMHVFTDFKERTPESISPESKIDQAIEEMKMTKVKSLLVVEEGSDVILGLVSSGDLQSMLTGIRAHQQGVSPKDLTVGMMMRKAEELPSIDFKDLSNARVGHIVRLIHELGVMHLLVTEKIEKTEKLDQMEEEVVVRGIFSATRISRQLGENITSDLSAHSIAEINRRLAL